MKLLRPLVRQAAESRYSIEDYAAWLKMAGLGGSFTFNGNPYSLGLNFTQPGSKSMPIGENFAGYVTHGLRSNGVVWTCAMVRLQVFAQARFLFQRLQAGRPGDLFGTRALSILERPWEGATTGDLLGSMGLAADFAGNAFVYQDGGELALLRPDWTDILFEERLVRGMPAGFRRVGYVHYHEGHRDKRPVIFLADEVAHYAPYPDPLAPFRGMSWLTPVIREVVGDVAANQHKTNFYENAATPNLAISLDKSVTAELFEQFVEAMDAAHKGPVNAGKTLYLGGGADVTVVGQNMQQLDFKVVQGAGETRIAAASGVGAIIAQFSEGMQGSSLNAGNYGAARRRFSDIPMRHAWQNVSGSLETLVPPPEAARLWYDSRDIAFLQEDERDAAEIMSRKATTIEALIRAGYTPDSARDAVTNDDFTRLQHTGLYSVQLQPAGTTAPATPDIPVDTPAA